MIMKIAPVASVTALLAAGPAFASSQAAITLTIEAFQVVDLDPRDGQPAGFLWSIRDLDYASAFSINTSAEHPPLTGTVYGNGSFSRNQAAAGVAQDQAESLGAIATASAYMPAAAGSAFTLSASGSASDYFGLPFDAPSNYYGEVGGGGFGHLFLLSNTQITVVGEVTATISGSSDTVSNNNIANAGWQIRMSPSNQGWDAQGSIYANSAQGSFAQTKTWPISITYSYRPNGTPIVYFLAQAYVGGAGAVTPVPESGSFAMLATGLLALLVRRSRLK